MKGVDRAVFAHGRPADGDYRSKVSEKCPRDAFLTYNSDFPAGFLQVY